MDKKDNNDYSHLFKFLTSLADCRKDPANKMLYNYRTSQYDIKPKHAQVTDELKAVLAETVKSSIPIPKAFDLVSKAGLATACDGASIITILVDHKRNIPSVDTIDEAIPATHHTSSVNAIDEAVKSFTKVSEAFNLVIDSDLAKAPNSEMSKQPIPSVNTIDNNDYSHLFKFLTSLADCQKDLANKMLYNYRTSQYDIKPKHDQVTDELKAVLAETVESPIPIPKAFDLVSKTGFAKDSDGASIMTILVDHKRNIPSVNTIDEAILATHHISSVNAIDETVKPPTTVYGTFDLVNYSGSAKAPDSEMSKQPIPSVNTIGNTHPLLRRRVSRLKSWNR